MLKGNEKTRWQKFFAAMVEHGHGHTSDISAISAQRQPQPKSEGRKSVAADQKSSRTFRFGALGEVRV